MLDSKCAQKNIHLSGFEIGGLIARKCTFKKENHVYEAKENIKYSNGLIYFVYFLRRDMGIFNIGQILTL